MWSTVRAMSASRSGLRYPPPVTSAPICDAFGLLRPGAEHRPALEVSAVLIAVERIEVVPVEHDVDADVLCAQHGVADQRVVGGMLGL